MDKVEEQSEMIISFQGAPGAYSDLACQEMCPGAKTLACHSFEEAFLAAENGNATHAMIPVDNTLAGRVADVHRLLPQSALSIIGEHYLKIRHCLLGVKGASLEDIEQVYSHVHALPQCRKFIERYNWKKIVRADTAGAAQEVAEKREKAIAAIASSRTAEIYGLEILKDDIQDEAHNTTRFILLSKEAQDVDAKSEACKTAFFFRVRDVPAALYKALGCFAVNGVQFTKLESYVDPDFNAAFFFAEIRGNLLDLSVQTAFSELETYTEEIKICGCYVAQR